MGKIPKAYPSYSEILRAQLGGGNFGSVRSPKDKDAEARKSSSERVTTDERDVEAQGSPIEKADIMTADLSAKGSSDPTLRVNPSKKKKKNNKKKKSKSSKKAVTDLGDGEDLAEKDQVTIDQSANGAKDPKDLAEKDRAGFPIAKRKEPASGGSLALSEKRLKRSHDSSSRSSGEIALPASRFLPWGGSDPPSDRLALAESECCTFRHEKDIPFVSDPGACDELACQIRGGMHLMPEIPKLAFPDRFVESAQVDMEAVFRKNQLISDYELALQGMASDFSRVEATIETKDVEIEKLKRAALEKSREIRTYYFRERKQAKQTSDVLEEELETAHSKIARLEAKVHRRELVSQTSCISAVATERFDKFRRYMVDRDKWEEKIVLHSEASGTLDSMDMLKDLGMPIPKGLIDTLTADKANFRREMEKVTVEVISEQDLVLPRFPGLEASQSLNQSDSSLENVDPMAASALRSPAPGSKLPATQGTPIGSRELMVSDSGGMRAGGRSGATSSGLVAED
ncbi:LOW QUALITY PROTEIN: hypothetical protein Bca101_057964 [Brassica carinata]